MSRCAAICLLMLACAGCRGTTGPDENYQQAAAIYQQLYATQLDDAYGDPRMDEVVALLGKVNPRSVDAHAAGMLLGTIQRGREELARERAEREKLAASAARSAAPTVNIDPSMILATAEPDAGPPLDPFGPGASVAELNKQSGGCLVDNEPFNEQGTGVGGTVYRVAPSDTCRSKLPGLVGQVVLVVNGKIYRRTADPRPPPAPVADAGAPPAKPAAAARPAQAPDAGEPQYYITVPGQPQPGATPPPAEQPR
ncbi:MAG: hypothetical protein ACXWLR_15885 [Myxococcales bacterium]